MLAPFGSDRGMRAGNSSQGIGIRIAAGSITTTAGIAIVTAIMAMTAIGTGTGTATETATVTNFVIGRPTRGEYAGLIVKPGIFTSVLCLRLPFRGTRNLHVLRRLGPLSAGASVLSCALSRILKQM